MTLFVIAKLITLSILLIISLIFLGFAIFGMLLAAPFVPSSKRKTKEMIEAANLQKDDVVYDLGSGDGRLVICAAKKGVKNAVGFELNFLLNLYATIKAKILKLDNTTFLNRSLWKADLSQCNKLFVYLLPGTMKKLQTKVLAEMKPGSLVISQSFSFPKLKPIKQVGKDIFVYKIK
jgi:hypothetical protein